jgi:hypothetical protein
VLEAPLFAVVLMTSKWKADNKRPVSQSHSPAPRTHHHTPPQQHHEHHQEIGNIIITININNNMSAAQIVGLGYTHDPYI